VGVPMGRDIAEERLAQVQRDLNAVLAASDVPMLLGGRKPEDECPRGHAYPDNPERYPAWHANAGSRRCTTCKNLARRRAYLRWKIRRYESIIREAL